MKLINEKIDSIELVKFPEYKCAVCGRDGIKSFYTSMPEGEDWERWCDPCITNNISKLDGVLIDPEDFLKIPPENGDEYIRRSS